MTNSYTDIPFQSADTALPRLQALTGGAPEGFAQNVTDALCEVSQPDTVLTRLERNLDAVSDRNAEMSRLATSPQAVRMLMAILGQSQFMTDLICNRPEHMAWLRDSAELDTAVSAGTLAVEMLTEADSADSFEGACLAMRRFKQREILRIGMRDLFKHAPIASLTEDLSNLADAAIQVAVTLAEKALHIRYGHPEHPCDDGSDAVVPARFVVLAMGKLGGRELNFSSDVDLLFVHSGEGQTTAGTDGTLSNSEYFNKLGELIIKALSEQTADGNIFRVDMRLRPHGRMGPLAVSLGASVDYYESYGQAWERQALIKVRAVAGNPELGARFIEETRPFTFPRYFDDTTLDDIQDVKRQMEEQIALQGKTLTEVKLGRGGIRDIEFTVQILQLLNGGRNESLRTPNTLQAIEALGKAGNLRPLEVTALSSHYSFLRRVEHRLQVEHSQQRHALPTDPAVLDDFARRLGYDSGPGFMAVYRDKTEETRGVLERFLSQEGSGHLWLSDLLNPHSSGETGLVRLGEMGFTAPDRARDELLRLCLGSAERPNSAHVRQLFRGIAPNLLEALAKCRHPDDILMRLTEVLVRLRAPSVIYDILRGHDHLAGYLIALVDNSPYLTGIITRDPGLFDFVGSRHALSEAQTRESIAAELDSLRRAYEPDAARYRLRDGELVRIGMRDLFAGIDVMEVGHELTCLADVCVQDVVLEARARAEERWGHADAGFAVLGLGKAGGYELGYGSDLDLVFVYESDTPVPEDISAGEYFTYMATQLIKLLKDPTTYGTLYDIDARLRPDGRSGALVVSSERLESYYRNDAESWERLALMKVRAMAGDEPFAAAMEQLTRDIAFDTPFTEADMERVEELRGRIAEKAGPLDLKKGLGGVAEIEFGVRMLQLRHVADHPELKRGDVLGALDALVAANLFDAEKARALSDNYILLRRVENRIRMEEGRSGSDLPASEEDQADFAHRLDLPHPLAEHVRTSKEQTHTIYQEIVNDTGN
jgi:glutamate-ammonia-ligase adenylyltransferase